MSPPAHPTDAAAQSLGLPLLLERVAAELADLAQRCRALQETTGDVARRAARYGQAGGPAPGAEAAARGHVPPDDGAGRLLVALQDLDAMTQMLDDLAALSGAIAALPATGPAAPFPALRGTVRLDSLASRLFAEARVGLPPDAAPEAGGSDAAWGGTDWEDADWRRVASSIGNHTATEGTEVRRPAEDAGGPNAPRPTSGHRS